jgi:hypothetical protein
MGYTRRQMLAGLGLSGLAAAMSPLDKKALAFTLRESLATESKGSCPFRLAVINDEITQDFEKHVRSCPAISGCGGSSCARCGTRT